MDAGGEHKSRRVEDVFYDFKGRRAGIIKALTIDCEEFFRQCDPEKENLSLYGFPDERWEVNPPPDEVPPDLPDPALGINFARDGMKERDWLSLVAVHSDSWLLSVAFYFGTRFHFDRSDRKRLFSMINDLPTVYETVTAALKEQTKEKSSVPIHCSNNGKSKYDSKRGSDTPAEFHKSAHAQEEEEALEEEDDEENTLCGKCNENYSTDEFWIWCEMCTTWFHGKCVRITQAKAANIKHYKCPSCSKKPRH
ncbi:unnamed protein product [Rhodiola kirilowii]